jgi:hypothetical protein
MHEEVVCKSAWTLHADLHTFPGGGFLRGIQTYIQMTAACQVALGRLASARDPVVLVRTIQLADGGDGTTQRALQDELRITQSEASRIVSALCEAGWLEQRATDQDRRVQRIRTTKSGGALLLDLEDELTVILRKANGAGRKSKSSAPEESNSPMIYDPVGKA